MTRTRTRTRTRCEWTSSHSSPSPRATRYTPCRARADSHERAWSISYFVCNYEVKCPLCRHDYSEVSFIVTAHSTQANSGSEHSVGKLSTSSSPHRACRACLGRLSQSLAWVQANNSQLQPELPQPGFNRPQAAPGQGAPNYPQKSPLLGGFPRGTHCPSAVQSSPDGTDPCASADTCQPGNPPPGNQCTGSCGPWAVGSLGRYRGRSEKGSSSQALRPCLCRRVGSTVPPPA